MIAKPLIIRLIKFSFVGISGIFINSLVLFLGHDILNLSLNIASPVAIIFAIYSNFNLNHYWTWRSRIDRSIKIYFNRLFRYYISAAIGGGINYIVLISCVYFFKINYLIANLVGIAAGTLSNYLFSEFWIFKHKAIHFDRD